MAVSKGQEMNGIAWNKCGHFSFWWCKETFYICNSSDILLLHSVSGWLRKCVLVAAGINADNKTLWTKTVLYKHDVDLIQPTQYTTKIVNHQIVSYFHCINTFINLKAAFKMSWFDCKIWQDFHMPNEMKYLSVCLRVTWHNH